MPPKASGSKAPPAQSTEQAVGGAAQSPAGEQVTPAATPTPSAASTPAPSSRPSLTPRASSTRGKPVVNAPRAANRRSQAARLEAAQTAARAKAAEAEAAAEEKKRKDREARRFGYRGNDRAGRGGGRGGRGRGGHMGDSHRSRDDDAVASGPFSSGQVTADAKAAYARRFGSGAGSSGGSGAFSGGGGPGGRSGGGSSGGGGSGIKSEPGTGGTFHMSVKGMKSEDGGYVSSDDEEIDTTLPKQDIDHMQVIDLTGEDAAPKRKDAFAPVRLTRVPHQERTVGLSIEESNAESIVAPPERTTTERKKGKQRAKDVEITGSTARPRRPTAYSSSSDTEQEQPYIKPDPDADDGENRATSPSAQDITTIPEALQDAPSSPETKRKAKERIKAIADSMGGDDSDDSDAILPEPPRFQTQAELDEWKRHYKDLRGIRNELGRQVPKSARSATDANGDTNMEGAPSSEDPSLVKARKQEETRSQHVYLFQFPPVLPSLVPISVKPDPDTHPAAGATDQDAMDVDQPANPSLPNPNQPKLPSGHVGKLRIHKSGKATLDWGGTSLLLGMGADATFLQNVLIATVPEKKPVVDVDKEKDNKGKKKEGEEELAELAVGMGMGQVRGKFVMTPDWDEILK